ncbi:MAG: Bcr/CflA family efflux MFS transporter [Gammaproteobacteria bacterium]|nr:MAG: Bcr/CflA family efflux MFS transporter [Gammaproteobacteria bacterium]UTW43846.1 multidrug effflux MFS transporter [bacterium SCSIO 12844]
MKKISLYIILSVCILTPMANDIFVASMPDMAKIFQTDHIQWILSIFLAGLAIPQLICGALSDQYGRKPVLLGGLIIFTVASFVIPLTSEFSVLLTARFFQAIGACCFIPSVFAISRDTYNKDQLVKVIGMVMLAIGIFPLLSPVIGAWLNYFFGWESSFYWLFTFGVVYLFLSIILFKETHTQRSPFNLKKLVNNYMSVCSIREFIGYSLVSACSYAILFAFMASATLIYFHEYNVSSVVGGNLIAVNGISIILMGIVSPKIAIKVGLNRWLFVGTLFLTIGGLCFLLGSLWFNESFLVVTVSMLITTIGVGIIRPIASAGAMQVVEAKVSGSASALFNLVSFLGGAVSTWVMGLIPDVTTFDFSIVNIILGVVACIFVYSLLGIHSKVNMTK